MAKYSDEFKLMIVKEYLEGPLGYDLLARKYEMPNKSPIQKWVNLFQAFGEDGLRRKHSKKVYSVQFKLDVLNFRKQTGSSFQETAIAFNINQSSMIAIWHALFLKKGIKGLKPKPKGRPSMFKESKSSQPKKQEPLF